MILFTQSTIQAIGATEQGEKVFYATFLDDKRQIVHKALLTEMEAHTLLKLGATDVSEKFNLKIES